jgi:hypothetical protein
VCVYVCFHLHIFLEKNVFSCVFFLLYPSIVLCVFFAVCFSLYPSRVFSCVCVSLYPSMHRSIFLENIVAHTLESQAYTQSAHAGMPVPRVRAVTPLLAHTHICDCDTHTNY